MPRATFGLLRARPPWSPWEQWATLDAWQRPFKTAKCLLRSRKRRPAAAEGDRTHDHLGQVPYALVHAARSPEAAALDEATVTEFLRERVAGYKVPQTVEFVDSPLRDDAGKACRSAVRAEIIARLQARASR